MAGTAVRESQATQASQVGLKSPRLFPVKKMQKSLLSSLLQTLTPRLEAHTHFSDALAHQFPIMFCQRKLEGRWREAFFFFQASANTLGSGDNSSDFSNNGGNSEGPVIIVVG